MRILPSPIGLIRSQVFEGGKVGKSLRLYGESGGADLPENTQFQGGSESAYKNQQAANGLTEAMTNSAKDKPAAAPAGTPAAPTETGKPAPAAPAAPAQANAPAGTPAGTPAAPTETGKPAPAAPAAPAQANAPAAPADAAKKTATNTDVPGANPDAAKDKAAVTPAADAAKDKAAAPTAAEVKPAAAPDPTQPPKDSWNSPGKKIIQDGKLVTIEGVNTKIGEKGAITYKDESGNTKISPMPDQEKSTISDRFGQQVDAQNTPQGKLDALNKGQKNSADSRANLQELGGAGLDEKTQKQLTELNQKIPGAMTGNESKKIKQEANGLIADSIVGTPTTSREKASAKEYTEALNNRGAKSVKDVLTDIRQKETQADKNDAIDAGLANITKGINDKDTKESTDDSYRIGFTALIGATGDTKTNIENALGTKMDDTIKFDDGRIFKVTGHKDGKILMSGEDGVTGGTVTQKVPYEKFKGRQLQDGTQLSGIYDKNFGGNLDRQEGRAAPANTAAEVKPAAAPAATQANAPAAPAATQANTPAQANAPAAPDAATQPATKGGDGPRLDNSTGMWTYGFGSNIVTKKEGEYTTAQDSKSGLTVIIGKNDRMIRVSGNPEFKKNGEVGDNKDTVLFRMDCRTNKLESIFDQYGGGDIDIDESQNVPNKYKKQFNLLKEMSIIN